MNTPAWQRTKSTLDLLTTAGMGVASIVIIWHLVGQSGPKARASEGPPKVEQVSISEPVSISGAPKQGSDSAPVVLIEYSDFQCPFCARHATETATKIGQRFVSSDKVQYVAKHFPLAAIHPHSVTAARWASCAQDQGKFWDLRAVLFSHRGDLAQANVHTFAETVAIQVSPFERCMRQPSTAARVQGDLDEGRRLGVASTPTFFFGRRATDGTIKLVSKLRGAAAYETFQEEFERIVAISQRF